MPNCRTGNRSTDAEPAAASVKVELEQARLFDIMSNAKLSASDNERLNTLMHNQHLLVSMNEALEELAKELKSLEQVDQTNFLSQKTVEGLDTLLLTVKELAHNYDDAEIRILKSMTYEEHQGLSRIREAYMSEEADLDADTKALLLSCNNHIDRLRSLFGSVGDSYRKLAGLAEGGAAARARSEQMRQLPTGKGGTVWKS